jgi:cytochrome c-type biogenesis protein CcmH
MGIAGRAGLMLLALALLHSAALAAAGGEDLDARAQAVAARLRCPVCQNESVADSPAELAAQMRALIRDRLASGQSEEQIVAYFVDRYGPWILLDPPRRGVLWAVWLTPVGAVLAGAVLAVAYLRRAMRPDGPPAPSDSPRAR